MAVSTDETYLRHEFTTWQSLYAVIAGWNVTTVRGAIAGHDTGSSFALSCALAVVASRYPPIFGALRQRKAPPLGLNRETFGGERGPGGLARAGFARLMRSIEPLFGDVFSDHAMLGFQVLQHVWAPSPDASILEPRTNLWPCSCVWLNPRSRLLEAITQDGRVPIVNGDAHWSIVGTGERPFLNGAIRALGETWAGARYAERDEEALSAYLGRLCPIGILPEKMMPGSKEGEVFKASVKDLGEAQSGGIFPFGSAITTLPNVDAGAAALFSSMLERRGRACVISLLGTDGTVSKGSPGVYTPLAAYDVAFAVAREDTAHAAAAFSRLGQAYGAINYGLNEEESPGYRWLLPDPTEAERLAALAKRYQDAAAIVKAEREAGLNVTPERVAAIYGALLLPMPALPETKASNT
jgi:hypothetical protein